jgi:hypothetical protein
MNKITLILAVVLSMISSVVVAQNDVYGHVGDIFYRQGASVESEQDQVYFRMNVSSGTAEGCMANGTEITWYVDLTSVNADRVIKLLEKSREEQKEIRLLGRDDVCSDGQSKESDYIFEVMPNWNPVE